MSGLSVLNNVGGKMRWINDRANETITLSQKEFDLLSHVFNPDNMSIYNVLRSSFSRTGMGTSTKMGTKHLRQRTCPEILLPRTASAVER